MQHPPINPKRALDAATRGLRRRFSVKHLRVIVHLALRSDDREIATTAASTLLEYGIGVYRADKIGGISRADG